VVSFVLPQLDMSETKRCIWIFGNARIVSVGITVSETQTQMLSLRLI